MKPNDKPCIDVWKGKNAIPRPGTYVVIRENNHYYRWYVPAAGRNKGKLTGAGLHADARSITTRELIDWDWCYWDDYVKSHNELQTKVVERQKENLVFTERIKKLRLENIGLQTKVTTLGKALKEIADEKYYTEQDGENVITPIQTILKLQKVIRIAENTIAEITKTKE